MRVDFPLALTLATALLSGCGVGALPGDDWVGAWGTALHQPAAAQDTTFRMIVHPTLAAETIRIRLSNSYGDVAVTFESVHAAIRSNGAAVDAASIRAVSFAGAPSVTVPVGAEVVSDPVDLPIAIGDDLAVSFYVADPANLSQHGAARAVSYLASGNHAAEAGAASFTSTATSWWSLVGVDALRPDALGTFVALGDSITDGSDPPDTNNRWPDYFAARLQDAGLAVGVLNAGIGANQVTQDTNFLGSSEAAVKRAQRDVFERPNVKWMVLFEGTNDLGQGISAEAVYAGLKDIADRARGRGIHVIAGTITPRGRDPFWNATLEEQRAALNDMIRAGVGTDFDQLADFDVALRQDGAPTLMAAEYDSGDGLHPNPLGLMAIADAVPIDALQ